MAGGWTRDGAVQDQIEDTVKDAVLRARAQLIVVSVLTAPSTFGAGGAGALASAASAATFSLAIFSR